MKQNVFEEVKTEREYQRGKWGHQDAKNSPYNWSAYISQYSSRHLIGDPNEISLEDFRTDMIKVAALAVAAIEALDAKA